MFGWLKKAVNNAGSGIVHGIDAAGKTIGKVPVVGGGLKGAFALSTAPLKLSGNIANGNRLDKAVFTHFKEQLGAAKDVGPYVQTVMSFVPGVGTAASGAIGAGLALANGQPISQAMLEAVKGALPGGATAKSIFNVTQGVFEGKDIKSIGISAIPGMNPTQQKALEIALGVAKNIAAGKNVAKGVYEDAMKTLPSDLQKAVATSIAVGHGVNLQKTLVDKVKLDDVKGFGTLGKKLAAKNPVLKAGFDTLNNDKLKTGFNVAMGLKGINLKPIDIVAIRNRLPGEQTKGFDVGMSTIIGMNTRKAPPHITKPKEQFGYFAAHGISGQPTKHKAAMVKAIMGNPEVKKGIHAAVKDTIWWKKLLKHIGIEVK